MFPVYYIVSHEATQGSWTTIIIPTTAHTCMDVGTRSVDCLQLLWLLGSFLGKFDHFAIPITAHARMWVPDQVISRCSVI